MSGDVPVLPEYQKHMKQWFTVDSIDESTYIISENRHWEETHCYLLIGTDRAVLVDTGLGICNIYEQVCIISDQEALQTSKDLARLEGIMCGISSGTNVAAAKKLAKILGEGKTVVTVLPDTAERYFSTPLFDGE